MTAIHHQLACSHDVDLVDQQNRSGFQPAQWCHRMVEMTISLCQHQSLACRYKADWHKVSICLSVFTCSRTTWSGCGSPAGLSDCGEGGARSPLQPGPLRPPSWTARPGPGMSLAWRTLSTSGQGGEGGTWSSPPSGADRDTSFRCQHTLGWTSAGGDGHCQCSHHCRWTIWPRWWRCTTQPLCWGRRWLRTWSSPSWWLTKQWQML